MQPLLLSIACLLTGGPGGEAEASFLYQPSYSMDKLLRGPVEAYVPQPGDIMLATDSNVFWKITHDLALAFEPHNSGIFFARSDGRLALLEAGPNDTLFIRSMDALPHIGSYAAKGPLWVRKRRVPITPEQSCALTTFAELQEGKFFALPRLGLQLTPFRRTARCAPRSWANRTRIASAITAPSWSPSAWWRAACSTAKSPGPARPIPTIFSSSIRSIPTSSAIIIWAIAGIPRHAGPTVPEPSSTSHPGFQFGQAPL